MVSNEERKGAPNVPLEKPENQDGEVKSAPQRRVTAFWAGPVRAAKLPEPVALSVASSLESAMPAARWLAVCQESSRAWLAEQPGPASARVARLFARSSCPVLR